MFDPFLSLNLEKSYTVDLDMLEKHYFEAQKKYHPDQFSQADEQKKRDAVRQSTAINQAYLLLKNPLKRAESLLRDAGVEILSNDASFLGQVMTWNENLEKGQDLKPELHAEEKMLLKELETAFTVKDYEKARIAVYRLTYVQKLLKRQE